jgi:hypothetical protein
LPNIQFPNRRFFTTNDPVMTPELLDYFFNERTRTFETLSDRKKALLHTIYDLPEYRAVLPALPVSQDEIPIRRHQRFSVKCPARITCVTPDGKQEKIAIDVIEVSRYGFQAHAHDPLPLNTWCATTIQLGRADVSHVRVLALREKRNGFDGLYGFRLGEPDLNWRKFVSALYGSKIYSDLDTATRFMQ